MASILNLKFALGTNNDLLTDNINKMDHILSEHEKRVNDLLQKILTEDKQKGDLDQLERDWHELMKDTYNELCSEEKAVEDLLIVEARIVRELSQAEKNIQKFLRDIKDPGLNALLQKVKEDFKEARKETGGLTFEAKRLTKFDGVHWDTWTTANLATMPDPETIGKSVYTVLEQAKKHLGLVDKHVEIVYRALVRNHEITKAGREPPRDINKLLALLEEDLRAGLKSLLQAESYKLLMMFKLLHLHFDKEEKAIQLLELPEEEYAKKINELKKELRKETRHTNGLAGVWNFLAMRVGSATR